MECHTIPRDPAAEVLNGEDLNRLIETAPQLMRTLAEVAGLSLGALRRMAEEGKLTSAELLGLP